AGITFSTATVIRLQDAFGNLATSDSSTVVSATRNAGTAALQGTTSVTAASGVATFSNLSYNKAEAITIDFGSGLLSGATSGSVTVAPAAANRLTILTQPSSTATAGAPFAQQPVVRIEDQFGNLRSGDNSSVVNAARSAGTGTLQGTATATASGGVASFSNLSYPLAETITIAFTSGGLSNAISGNVVVGGGTFCKLQMLLPGESAAPGTASGKTGTPTAQTAGTPFNVTVNAVDANWNVVSTATDTVAIASSDLNAILPANAALVNGSQTFSVTLNTAGNATVTA